MKHDTQAIKALLPLAAYCRELGIELHGHGKELRGICPLCHVSERHPFAVNGFLWRCNACDMGGDVIRLIEVMQQLTPAQAIAMAADLAGIDGEPTEEQRRQVEALRAQEAQRAQEQAKARETGTKGAKAYWLASDIRDDDGLAYLESRGLRAARSEVRFRPGAVCVPLRGVDGEVINVVRRYHRELRPKESKIVGLKGCSTAGMFGNLADVDNTVGPVVLVEGLTDWLSARVLLPSALVLGAHGANRLADVAKAGAKVAKVRGAVVVPHFSDMGKAGAKAANAAIRELRREGVSTVRRFELAQGDLNDYLKAGGDGQALLDAPLVDDERVYTEDDLGNAELFAHLHQDTLRYLPALDQWLHWDGQRWEEGRSAVQLVRAAKVTVAHLDGDHASKSRSLRAVNAMISLARAEPELAVDHRELDGDPFLLCCANGTLDLRTGELGPHRREDLITIQTPVAYDPDAQAPRWERFVQEVFEPHPDAAEFVQRYAGYSLTGDTSAQCLLFAHGGGANGKGVLFRVMRALLGGTFAETLPMGLLVRERPLTLNADYLLAKVARCRAVFVSEGRKGDQLDNQMINAMTGEDMLDARQIRGQPFSYSPRFKIWIASNHLPGIDADDFAMWRRFRLVPFHATFDGAKRDDTLTATLLSELPGILAWAVRGCLAWQSDGGGLRGLEASESVRQATQAHRDFNDDLGQFLAAECVTDPELLKHISKARAGAVYNRYKAWMTAQGLKPLASREFGVEMRERGLESYTESGNRAFYPIALHSKE